MRLRVPEQVGEQFWARHSNPKSGWTRVPIGPVIVYALYRRDWRFLAVAVCWVVVNPLVFPPPESDAAWMTRAVRAERWWLSKGNCPVGLTYPSVCTTAGAVGFLGALIAAWRRQPVAATLGTVASVGLKLWWLRVLVRRYDRQRGG